MTGLRKKFVSSGFIPDVLPSRLRARRNYCDNGRGDPGGSPPPHRRLNQDPPCSQGGSTSSFTLFDDPDADADLIGFGIMSLSDYFDTG